MIEMWGLRGSACLALSMLLVACAEKDAGGVHGSVLLSDGMAATSAAVTLTEPGSGIRHTAYADAEGKYRFALERAEGWNISVVLPGNQPMDREIEDTGEAQDFTLAADAEGWRSSTSDNWLAVLPDGQMRRELILNCTTCHELSASRVMVDGKPRDANAWGAAIAYMRSMDIYKVVPPDFDDETYAKWLAAAFTPETVPAIAVPKPIDAALAGRVEITEYPYPNQADMPHDLVIAKDGKIWTTGFFDGDLKVLDPETGATRSYPVNGGKPGGDVRALKFARDGKLWAVLGATQSLVKLNMNTGKYDTFPVGMYAHDVELDSRDMPWVNDYLGKPERVARLDPATGKLTEFVIDAPQLSASEGDPLPYGLQIDRQDILWGSQLAANTLFRLDPKTGKSQVFPMPEYNSGPRRLALGIDGTIWIPEWNTGYLTGFDPRTNEFTRHKLGGGTIGLYDAEVDPRSGVVWVTGSLASTVIRFDPRSGKIDTIPLPTNPGFMRHIAVDPRNGDVWTTYAQLPSANPMVVRIRVRD
jgi:virginiamycin B lyase